jgi:hypothetical protein
VGRDFGGKEGRRGVKENRNRRREREGRRDGEEEKSRNNK